MLFTSQERHLGSLTLRMRMHAQGTGTISDLVAGLDWVAMYAERPAVASLSSGRACRAVVQVKPLAHCVLVHLTIYSNSLSLLWSSRTSIIPAPSCNLKSICLDSSTTAYRQFRKPGPGDAHAC